MSAWTFVGFLLAAANVCLYASVGGSHAARLPGWLSGVWPLAALWTLGAAFVVPPLLLTAKWPAARRRTGGMAVFTATLVLWNAAASGAFVWRFGARGLFDERLPWLPRALTRKGHAAPGWNGRSRQSGPPRRPAPAPVPTEAPTRSQRDSSGRDFASQEAASWSSNLAPELEEARGRGLLELVVRERCRINSADARYADALTRSAAALVGRDLLAEGSALETTAALWADPKSLAAGLSEGRLPPGMPGGGETRHSVLARKWEEQLRRQDPPLSEGRELLKDILRERRAPAGAGNRPLDALTSESCRYYAQRLSKEAGLRREAPGRTRVTFPSPESRPRQVFFSLGGLPTFLLYEEGEWRAYVAGSFPSEEQLPSWVREKRSARPAPEPPPLTDDAARELLTVALRGQYAALDHRVPEYLDDRFADTLAHMAAGGFFLEYWRDATLEGLRREGQNFIDERLGLAAPVQAVPPTESAEIAAFKAKSLEFHGRWREATWRTNELSPADFRIYFKELLALFREGLELELASLPAPEREAMKRACDKKVSDLLAGAALSRPKPSAPRVDFKDGARQPVTFEHEGGRWRVQLTGKCRAPAPGRRSL